MHEYGIALDIYRISEESVRDHRPGRVETVRVVVGELSAVEPDLLRFAWEAVVAEGPDAGAALEVEWRRARQSCPACGEEKPRGSGDWFRLCPECGSPLRVDGGKELDVLQVVFASEDET